MADFKTHLMGAALISGVAATALFMTGQASHPTVVGYFLLGVIGGLLPDIDSNRSIPLRMLCHSLAVIGAFLVMFTVGRRYSLVELSLLWLLGFVVVRYGVYTLLTRFTVHRGLLHSLPAGALWGLLATWLAYNYYGASALHAWCFGVFLCLGYWVHLLLDEMYSVNLLGMELKASFGTAVNLGDRRNPLGTLALYAAVGGMVYVNPPPDAFFQFLRNGALQRSLVDRLLPSQGWFQGLW
jgi:hypothetical protein